MSERYTLVVRTGKGCPTDDSGYPLGFTDAVETICRAARRHVCWHSVTYKGRRYRLSGGIRTPYFINLNNPIR